MEVVFVCEGRDEVPIATQDLRVVVDLDVALGLLDDRYEVVRIALAERVPLEIYEKASAGRGCGVGVERLGLLFLFPGVQRVLQYVRLPPLELQEPLVPFLDPPLDLLDSLLLLPLLLAHQPLGLGLEPTLVGLNLWDKPLFVHLCLVLLELVLLDQQNERVKPDLVLRKSPSRGGLGHLAEAGILEDGLQLLRVQGQVKVELAACVLQSTLGKVAVVEYVFERPVDDGACFGDARRGVLPGFSSLGRFGFGPVSTLFSSCFLSLVIDETSQGAAVLLLVLPFAPLRVKIDACLVVPLLLALFPQRELLLSLLLQRLPVHYSLDYEPRAQAHAVIAPQLVHQVQPQPGLDLLLRGATLFQRPVASEVAEGPRLSLGLGALAGGGLLQRRLLAILCFLLLGLPNHDLTS